MDKSTTNIPNRWLFNGMALLPDAEFKIVVLLMAHENGKTKKCCPSQKRLAELSGMSERKVRRCIASLVKKGKLKVVTPRGSLNEYVLVDKSR